MKANMKLLLLEKWHFRVKSFIELKAFASAALILFIYSSPHQTSPRSVSLSLIAVNFKLNSAVP